MPLEINLPKPKKKNIKPFEAEMLTAKTTAFLPKSLEFANSPVSHHRR
jgi:hypothetical protein